MPCIIAVTHDEEVYDRFDKSIHPAEGRLDGEGGTVK